MSEQSRSAQDIEQRYVAEHAETEDILTGLDPDDTDRDAADEVEAVSDDQEDQVETMTRDERRER